MIKSSSSGDHLEIFFRFSQQAGPGLLADDISRRPQDDQSLLHVETSPTTGVERNAEFLGIAIIWIDPDGAVKCKIKAQT